MTENDSERLLQLRTARKVLTVFVVVAIVLIALCGFFLSSIGTTDTKVTVKPSPTAAPTQPLELITVEYQIEVVAERSSTLVKFWYTSESGEQNQADSLWINTAKPFTKTVAMSPGKYVEIGGIFANSESGKLVCRILVDDVLINQSSSYDAGAGVLCSGAAITRR